MEATPKRVKNSASVLGTMDPISLRLVWISRLDGTVIRQVIGCRCFKACRRM